MKTTKLIVGILMIILSIFIIFQSMVAGIGNAVADNHEVSGSAGVITALGYLIAGIVYIVVHKSDKLSGDIVNLVILLLVWLMGFTSAGSYSDLTVWAWIAFIIGVGFCAWHLLINHKSHHNNTAPHN